ncbi:MAG: hypothetical protein IK066_02005 [Kiritimatiellae bacterium]|nr:hypothetical protein [Kiritimatiellia bacterium]
MSWERKIGECQSKRTCNYSPHFTPFLTLEITDYDLDTGVVKVRVTPGEGNTIGTDLLKGVVRMSGGASPSAFADLSEMAFTVDSEDYLASDLPGEFKIHAVIDFGTTTFFRIAIAANP